VPNVGVGTGSGLAAIVAMRQEGQTYDEIGRGLGVSRERTPAKPRPAPPVEEYDEDRDVEDLGRACRWLSVEQRRRLARGEMVGP
jgi:hypothetical protein